LCKALVALHFNATAQTRDLVRETAAHLLQAALCVEELCLIDLWGILVRVFGGQQPVKFLTLKAVLL